MVLLDCQKDLERGSRVGVGVNVSSIQPNPVHRFKASIGDHIGTSTHVNTDLLSSSENSFSNGKRKTDSTGIRRKSMTGHQALIEKKTIHLASSYS